MGITKKNREKFLQCAIKKLGSLVVRIKQSERCCGEVKE